MSQVSWEDYPLTDEKGVIWMTPSVFIGSEYQTCFNCKSPTIMIDINFEGPYCGCELDPADFEYDEPEQDENAPF